MQRSAGRVTHFAAMIELAITTPTGEPLSWVAALIVVAGLVGLVVGLARLRGSWRWPDAGQVRREDVGQQPGRADQPAPADDRDLVEAGRHRRPQGPQGARGHR